MITDTHAHLFWKNFDEDRAAVIERARTAGVERIILVGTDLETSRACKELCTERPGLYWTAGIHPHDADGIGDEALGEITALCEDPACIAVGETGLDYFKEYSPKTEQRRLFRWHIALAKELDKPVIVHCRDAHADTLALLREVPDVRGVMHCYTMGPEELSSYVELGLYVSFSGVVTYPRNEANREAARLVPPDQLLVETDCPFLAPQSRRGKRNEPALVAEVLDCIAEVRGATREDLARTTTANAARLFGLPPAG